MSKRYKQNSYKKEIQLIYKYLELCSSSLALKMHNKTTMNDVFCPSNYQKSLYYFFKNYNI